MNKMILFLVLLIVFSWTMAQSPAEKKAAAERKRSFGGQRTINELKKDTLMDQRVPINDSKSSLTRNQQVITPNIDQPATSHNNAPAVVQITTTESGSAAILSENNGRDRDGTGNVQRSSLNIAGAKIPGNLNLYKDNSIQKNVVTGSSRIRKQEMQPAPVSSLKEKQKENIMPQNKRKNKVKQIKSKGKDPGK